MPNRGPAVGTVAGGRGKQVRLVVVVVVVVTVEGICCHEAGSPTQPMALVHLCELDEEKLMLSDLGYIVVP